jgi:hypothetical protein
MRHARPILLAIGQCDKVKHKVSQLADRVCEFLHRHHADFQQGTQTGSNRLISPTLQIK